MYQLSRLSLRDLPVARRSGDFGFLPIEECKTVALKKWVIFHVLTYCVYML